METAAGEVMNSTRSTILNHIRQALQRNQLTANTIAELEARLAARQIHEQPTLATDLTTTFIKQLTKVAGTVEIIPRTTDIPFAVLTFLQQQQLPHKIVAAASLKTINWPPQWQVAYRAAQPNDQVSVSYAFAGIAETGSLVLLSSPNSPTTLNFLPSNHIIILSQADLVAHPEAVWTRLRSQPFPRTINIITGPSRTADIEQTLQVGAHGPKRLHVILNTQK
jgi:L-lactate dehydrogenase complex protein LldG